MLSLEISAIVARANVTTQTTQPPTEPKRSAAPVPPQKIPRVEVYWTAVTYKTVLTYGTLLGIILLAILFLAMPNLYFSIANKISSMINDSENEAISSDQRQAKFVNLDGKVQVKKVNSVQWVDADYRTSLDKGDLIQTASDGAARITFADGTTYTVKPDTLVTVEENSTENNKPTSVAMRINTGAVNLATPNWTLPDSKATVIVQDATAQLHSNSRAAVKSDSDTKQGEIVVSSGSASVQRGEEKIDLAPWEKVNISSGTSLLKSSVLAPPDLIEPLNLAPIIAENAKAAAIHFSWKAVSGAVSYTLRVSTNAMFTKTVKQARVANSNADLSGLDAGDYFWNVMATDSSKQTSEVSETFKFSLVTQGKSQDMVLELDVPQIHGRVAEIIGRTEPGAALIVNGQSVPNISADGSFRHFTEPLEPGEHTVVVIGQNRRGGTAKQQVSFVVPK